MLSERTGCRLADGDGIEQLALGDPAEALDQVGAQEGDEDVARAEEEGTGLQEDQEDGQRDRRRRWSPRPRTSRLP